MSDSVAYSTGISVSFGVDLSAFSSGISSAKDMLSSFVEEATSIFEPLSSMFSEVMSSLNVGNDSGISSLISGASEASDALSQLDGTAEGIETALDSLSSASEAIDGVGIAAVEASSQVADLGNAGEQAASSLQNAASVGAAPLSSSLSNMGSGISGFIGGIGSMGSSVLGFAQNVGFGWSKLQMLGNMATQVGSALLGPAAQAEQNSVAFTTLMHSASAASDELQRLNSFASQTPFQTQDINAAAEKLLAFGTNSNAVIPDITAIGDSLSALGRATPNDLSSVIDIFGKIQASGKLTGQDMNQLSSYGIPAWQALSKAMGEPIPVLQKMVSSVKGISAGDALPALQKGMEATFGGGMAKQASTFNGLMSTLQSNVTLAMAAFGSPLLKLAEGSLSQIGSVLSSSSFQSFAGTVGQGIANVFQKIGNFVKSDVEPAINGLIGYFSSPVFKAFGGDIGYLAQELVKLDISNLKNQFNSMKPVLSEVGNIFKDIVGTVGSVAKNIGDLIAWFMKGSEPAKTLAAALTAVGIGIEAVKIVQFLQSLPALLSSLQIWAVGQWEVATAALATAAPYILIGAVVAAVAFGIIEAIQHWGQITTWLKGVWTAFSAWFEGALHAIGSFFASIWNGIKTGLQTAWNAIVNVVKVGAMLLLEAALGPIYGIVAGFEWLYNHNYYFKNLVDAIVGFFKGLFDWAIGEWKGFIDNLGRMWQGAVTIATNAWNSVSSGIKMIVGTLVGWLEDAWNTEITGLSRIWNTLSGWATQAWDAVVGVFTGAWDKVKSPLLGFWNSLVNTVNGWVDKFNQFGINLIQGFINGITSMLGNVGKAAGQVASKIASFLGFHSPSKEGPGAEADVWAPNFVKMYAQGLTDGLPQIQAALNSLTAPLALDLGSMDNIVPASYSSQFKYPTNAASNGAQQIHVHVTMPPGETTLQIDGQKFGKAVAPHVGKAMVKEIRVGGAIRHA